MYTAFPFRVARKGRNLACMISFQKGRLISWAFYDFANTIFSAIVLTAYFPLYLTEIAGANWYLGVATTGSMILAGLSVPFLGALSDHTGKTKTYLLRSTLLAIAFLIPLSITRSVWTLVGCFLMACYFYHASLVFYNSLLPVAAPIEKQGFASGLGTGLGYLGVIVALPIAHLVDQSLGRSRVFLVAGLLFLIFSLPLFAFVPERPVEAPKRFQRQSWLEEWRRIRALLGQLPQTPALLLFLGGNFFVMEAMNSMIFWFLVFVREMFHPSQSQLITLFAATNAMAFLYGLAAGFLTDRLGAMKTMLLASFSLALCLAALASAPTFTVLVAVSLTLSTFGVAGIWTAGRKALLDLVPKEELGSYFGLYGLTTKISVVGSLFFSIVSDLIGIREALWVLLFPATVGFAALFFSYRLTKSGSR